MAVRKINSMIINILMSQDMCRVKHMLFSIGMIMNLLWWNMHAPCI